MTAASMLKHVFMVEPCPTSLPSFFTAKPSHPSLHFPSNPIKLALLGAPSSFSPFISFNNKLPLLPLVTRTSDWARQEDNSVAEEEGFGWDKEEKEEQSEGDEGVETGLSGWEADGSVSAESGGDAYPEPPEEAKLFVGNLPYDLDSEKLAQLFDKAGVVEVAEVIYSRGSDQSRGFGFVTMSTVVEAERAVEMLHQYDVSGRILTVNKAAPRGSRQERAPREFEPSFKIYVGNLPWQVNDARLEQVFSEHGKVVNARVVYDRESGRSRGFGFVTMATQTEVDDAIAALDGQSLDGRTIRVNIAEERARRRSSF